MAFAKINAYEVDRRQLLRLTGTMGVAIGASYVVGDELLAAGMCDQIIIENGEVDATQAGATLQYWIDGLHLAQRTDLGSRANLTLWMDLQQTAEAYVESVVFMNEDKKTLAARYFDSSMKMLDGRVPYVTFDNMALDATKTYYIVYTVRQGSRAKLYSAMIQNPEVSRLNTTFLPQQMRTDFEAFLLGNTANPTPGLITNQFQYYTKNGLGAHTARGRVSEMASDGSAFKVNIDFMHGDSGADHYMRYFIVMDPVGRLLGFHKRMAPGENGQSSGALDVSKVTDQQKTAWGIPSAQVGNIADCPYIQIYTEDSYDAIARNVIRFR